MAEDLHGTIRDIFGSGAAIRERGPVAGGDINRAYALTLTDGTKLFMKMNSAARLHSFEAEAEGLEAIRRTGTISVPRVIAAGIDAGSESASGGQSYLLIEYIEEGSRSAAASVKLGRQLAALHQADTAGMVSGGRFGFLHDNYIGAGDQSNAPEDSWKDFFINKRLVPQFERASVYWSAEDERQISRFLASAEGILTEPEHPSLLHGDLWAGNYMIDTAGTPWLIDPAACVGHAEADLAMTELFGGFDRHFYAAYKEAAPLDPGYRERRDIYNLYHLLNHLNLFGGGYLHAVKAVVNKYTS